MTYLANTKLDSVDQLNMKHKSKQKLDDHMWNSPQEKRKVGLSFFIFESCMANRFLLSVIILVTALWGCGEALLPYGMMMLIDSVISFYTAGKAITYKLYLGVVGYVALLGFYEALNRFSKFLQLRFYVRAKCKLRHLIFYFIDEQELYTIRMISAPQLTRLTNETSKHIENLYRVIFDSLLPVTCTLFCVSIILYQFHLVFPVIFCAWFLIMISVTLIFSRKSSKLSTQQAQSEDRFFKTLHDIFLNVRANKVFGTPVHRFYTTVKHESERAYTRDKYLWGLDIIRSLISVIAVGLTWILILRFLHLQMISVGEFSFALFMSLTMIKLSWWCSEQIMVLRKDLGVLRFMDQQLRQLRPPQPQNSHFKKPIRGSIKFEDVTFGYANHIILSKINFEVYPGELVGITGPSGAGKSSILDLIMGILKPQSGNIYLDQVNVARPSHAELTRFISFMPQESTLYNQTILQNLCGLQRKLTAEEIRHILELTQCLDFIEKLPDGFETLIREHGKNLSLGQRRRILLARALLKDAPILILDEPTSSLDSKMELQIFNDIVPALNERTVIMTTHTTQTLSNVDRIVEIKDRKCIEPACRSLDMNQMRQI